MEIGDDFLFFIFYFRPEEPAAPVLTLRPTRCAILATARGGAAPSKLGPLLTDSALTRLRCQEDHYSVYAEFDSSAYERLCLARQFGQRLQKRSP